MRALVTGGAGFIGRWLVKQLLDDGHQVWILDNLANGRRENVREFEGHPGLRELVIGDIQDGSLLDELFENRFDVCYHLAATINVQDSIDDPRTTFLNDVVGTFEVLERCRDARTKMVFMSTCMVYDRATGPEGISETHAVKPASPYAGSKIAAENLVLSYFNAYGLPVVVVRPFNTYGPFQKSGGEGGVVAIFIKNKLTGQPLRIYGDGTQTRDLLYVEDCARFVAMAGYSDVVNGEIINAGLGRDISINDLAMLVAQDATRIQHVKHIHPQSEIMKLLCNADKAKRLLGWEPRVTLEEGLARTEAWIRETPWA
ncbi:dTDP-glucose 4,6-dehydratase [Alicyclobacillus macrosporangiidus]|uniref:dTDP-glucose 4,6-dehydratase n=1 Tax=Alicyclobacillus macrosporangiidus TaxID=392015 RepID=UPI000496FD47|nr:NAD-dependent epimerase/dehydratase family protein [Alicyclobacillus macrosporangiidus]